MKTRRMLAAAAGLLGAAFLVSAHLEAQATPNVRSQKPAYDDGNVEAIPVQGNVWLVAGSGANITVQVDPDGLLVVDTSVAAMSDKVLAAIRTIADKPI